ncbi:MAG: DUF2061 domain-containing protein [Caulobacteraceae bacterium]
MFIRVPEARSRSFVKALSWRLVGSIDTFIISYLITGKLSYAGAIISIETVTKVLIYYFHEQFWAWLPWWRPVDEQQAKALVAGAKPAAP